MFVQLILKLPNAFAATTALTIANAFIVISSSCFEFDTLMELIEAPLLMAN